MDHFEKAKRITSIENDIEEHHLRKWVPEIWFIEDEDLRDETIRTFLRLVPDKFLNGASSSSGKYHSEEETKTHGNVLHTKRVFAKAERLCRTKLAQERITEYEQDLILIGALLHDAWKYGWPSQDRDHTTSEHDEIGAAIVMHCTDLPNEVAQMIYTHQGAWGSDEMPQSELDDVLHDADMVASDKGDHSDVYLPCDELLALGAVEREINSKERLERIVDED